MADEESGGSYGIGQAVQDGRAAAEARFAKEEAAPAPEPKQEAAPQEAAPSQGTASTTPATAAEQEWEYQHEGQGYKFKKDQVNYLIRMGVNAIREAQRKQAEEQPAAQAAPKAAPQESTPKAPQDAWQTQYEKYLADARAEARAAKEQVDQFMTEQRVGTIIRAADEAFGKEDYFKQFSDPDDIRDIKREILQRQADDPHMTPETAAKKVAEKLERLARNIKSDYVKEKVTQASKKVESGGGIPAIAKKPMGKSDLYNGGVMQRALRRLTGANS